MRVSDYQEDEIVEGCLSGGRMYQKLLYEKILRQHDGCLPQVYK